MAALIKTLNHEKLGKKRITNTKNVVHEIVSVRPKHEIVKNCGHI
jgi:hypothetical protein